MDNFDLKKYLVENKATKNSQMLHEVTNVQDIINKLKAGDFAALEKHPADMKIAKTIFNVLKQSQPELLKKLKDYAEKNKASLNEVSLKTTLLGALMALSLGMGVGSGFVKSTDKTPVDTEMTAQGQQSRELDKYKEDYKTQQSAMKSAGYDKELMQDLVNFGEGKPVKNPVKLLKALQRHDVNSASYGDFS